MECDHISIEKTDFWTLGSRIRKILPYVRELNLVLNNDSKKDGWTDDGEGSRASRPSIGSTTSSDSCEPMDVLSSSS